MMTPYSKSITHWPQTNTRKIDIRLKWQFRISITTVPLWLTTMPHKL